MTKVEITMAEPRYAMIFDGHATGSAEVCAGISALMFSLEGFLNNHEDELFLLSCKTDKPGWAYIMFELEDPSPKIKGAFELIVIGLLQIQESYPEYCEVTVKDINQKKIKN